MVEGAFFSETKIFLRFLSDSNITYFIALPFHQAYLLIYEELTYASTLSDQGYKKYRSRSTSGWDKQTSMTKFYQEY